MKTDNTAPTDPRTCANRYRHRERLGQICESCASPIPGGNMYGPSEMATYFPKAAIVETPHPFPQTAEETALLLEYEGLTPLRDAAIDDLQNAQRGRASVSGTTIDADGNTVRNENVRQAAYQGDAAITAAKQRLEDIRDEGSRLLLEINKLGLIRGAKARRAMYEESYPPAPAGIVGRIRGAISGT